LNRHPLTDWEGWQPAESVCRRLDAATGNPANPRRPRPCRPPHPRGRLRSRL